MKTRRDHRRWLATRHYCELHKYWESLPWFVEHPEIPHPEGLAQGLEMHEVIGRGNAPMSSVEQNVLWMPGNTLWLCHACHQAASWAIHKVGWKAWSIDLLMIARSKDEIQDFMRAYLEVFRHTHPVINLLAERLEEADKCTRN